MSMIKNLFNKDCLTVPNLLSLIRIILVPVFAVLFHNGHILWAVIVLILSGLSDTLDGKIARRFNQVSDLGKLLDPIADKITQITIAVMLFVELGKSSDPTMKWFKWVFLFFLAKELLMIVIAGIMLLLNIRPGAAEIYGKAATVAFYVVMGLVITFGPEIGAISRSYPQLTLPNFVMIPLVILAAVLTFAALLSYAPGTLRQFKERKQQNKEEK